MRVYVVLSLLLTCFMSQVANAITRQQYEQQLADKGDPIAQAKVNRRNKLKAYQDNESRGGGNVCQEDTDCHVSQYCRKVKQKPKGLCVEKAD